MSSSKYYFFGIEGGAPIVTVNRVNGFGSHPVIWKYLCKKYLDSDCWLLTVERFWKEPEKILHRMTPDDRFLLRVTYDGFLTLRTDFVRLARILRDITRDPSEDRPDYLPEDRIDHWTRRGLHEDIVSFEDIPFKVNLISIASILKQQAENTAILGMGVYATSVSDDPWRTYPPQDEDGNELEGEHGWVDARTAPCASDSLE